MRKLLLLTMLFMLQAASVSAAEDKQLVHRLQQAYADVAYFEADFTQEKMVKHLSKPLISKGKIKFAKEHGMIWEIIEPIAVQTKINQQGIFKTNQFFKDKKVKDVQMKAVADIFSELLSSKLDRIEGQFDVENAVYDEGTMGWQVTLKAKSAVIKKALKALLIKGSDFSNKDQITSAKNTEPSSNEQINQGIQAIQIIDQAGNSTTISFDNVVTKGALDSELVDVFH